MGTNVRIEAARVEFHHDEELGLLESDAEILADVVAAALRHFKQHNHLLLEGLHNVLIAVWILGHLDHLDCNLRAAQQKAQVVALSKLVPSCSNPTGKK